MGDSIREKYELLGVEEYYRNYSLEYKNPHEKTIKKLISWVKEQNIIQGNVLDLCCGSGEITRNIEEYEVVGLDPYTYESYHNNTGKEAFKLSFKDIIQGKLDTKFDTIICSFALHLCPTTMLPQLLWRLSQVSSKLIVISPNKKPECDKVSNWILVDEKIIDRIRLKVYLN